MSDRPKRPRANYKKLATEYILTFGWMQAFRTEAAPGETDWLDTRIPDSELSGWDERKYERLLVEIRRFIESTRPLTPDEQEHIRKWYAATKGED